MNFEDFCNELIERVRREEKEDCHFKRITVAKNNGVFLTGLVRESPASRISPTIYLDSLYERYQDGAEVAELAEEVVDTFARGRSSVPKEVDDLVDPGFIRSHLVYRLVHYERNRELLQSVPHRRFLDLAVMYSVFLSSGGDYTSSILVRNEHMGGWKLDGVQMERFAAENSPKLLPARIRNIRSVLTELMGEESADAGLPDDAAMEMYVATNEYGVGGASVLLYPEALQSFAEERRRDLYVLPSSVHEVLLLPAEKDSDPEELKKLVQFVNQTQVRSEEQLSDTVYLFRRETRELEVV